MKMLRFSNFSGVTEVAQGIKLLHTTQHFISSCVMTSAGFSTACSVPTQEATPNLSELGRYGPAQTELHLLLSGGRNQLTSAAVLQACRHSCRHSE